jgi:hypothetical protein
LIDFHPRTSHLILSLLVEFKNGSGLSVGAVIGIVAASCVLAALFLLLLRSKGYLGGKELVDKGGTESISISLV